MKILVAEDSPTILAIIQFALDSAGFSVITANDGIEVVEKAYKEAPDIIISDIMMPRMNGYQACRLLKGDSLTSSIPIIMITTKTAESDRFWGLKTGADDYLVKPFEPAELVERIENIINRFNLREKREEEKAGTVHFNSNQIISQVNDLLDRELFRSTLVNEVSRTATQIGNFPQIIKSILDLVRLVVKYLIAGILLPDLEEGSLTLSIEGNLKKEVILEFKERVVKAYNDQSEFPLNLDSLKTESYQQFSGEEIIVDTYQRRSLKSFHIFSLEAGERTRAIISVASVEENAFPSEDLELLSFLRNQMAIILDNALLHKEAAERAITDGLTGLSTHRRFQEALDEEINRAKRHGSYFSLVMLDIDDFKNLNDAYGHLIGDKVLVRIAQIMKEHSRGTDVVARYGGEEFVVILSETDKEGALIAAERLREAIEKEAFMPGGIILPVTISLGVSIYPQDTDSKIELIRMADKALYRAKAEGKNKVCLYQENKKAKDGALC